MVGLADLQLREFLLEVRDDVSVVLLVLLEPLGVLLLALAGIQAARTVSVHFPYRDRGRGKREG